MKLIMRLKGGEGSGNFDHKGRPGEVGGSGPGGGSAIADKNYPTVEGWDYKHREGSSFHEYTKVVDGIEISISDDTSLHKGDRVWNLTYTNLNSGLPNDMASKRYINASEVADPGVKGMKYLMKWAVDNFDSYKTRLTSKPKKTRRSAAQRARDNFVLYD